MIAPQHVMACARVHLTWLESCFELTRSNLTTVTTAVILKMVNVPRSALTQVLHKRDGGAWLMGWFAVTLPPHFEDVSSLGLGGNLPELNEDPLCMVMRVHSVDDSGDIRSHFGGARVVQLRRLDGVTGEYTVSAEYMEITKGDRKMFGAHTEFGASKRWKTNSWRIKFSIHQRSTLASEQNLQNGLTVKCVNLAQFVVPGHIALAEAVQLSPAPGQAQRRAVHTQETSSLRLKAKPRQSSALPSCMVTQTSADVCYAKRPPSA